MPQGSERPQKLVADSIASAFIRYTGRGKKQMAAQEIEANIAVVVEESQLKCANKIATALPKINSKANSANARTVEDTPTTPAIRKNSEISHSKMMNRLKNKTKKINLYWAKQSPVIPNVFKMNFYVREEPREVIEFNDLSLKSILVMAALQKSNNANTNFETEDIFNSGSEHYKFGGQNHPEEDDLDFADLDIQFKLN